MTTNNRIKVTDIDFNDIRENLKTFLSGQSQFNSYDFDGSAMSVLLDVLAYNTHYNALYTNLAINEMFLDSASKRSSVVSIANNFGYLPKSAVASKAIVNITVTMPPPAPGAPALNDYIVISKYTPFSSSINGRSFTFYTIKDYSARKNNTQYFFEDVEIYEGVPQIFTFICTEVEQKLTLPNLNIDISTLVLTVQENGESLDYSPYTLANNVLELTSESEVYYLKEAEDESYQIYFGTNNLGKPIVPGNVITVQYLTTNRGDGDGASVFTYTGASVGGTVTVLASSSSSGGSEKETIDEIRVNIPKSFSDQNRAVTTEDYASIIRRYYSDIKSISVWGGEDHDPPQYGKVYIAIKPNTKPYLDETEKTFIKRNVIKNRNVVSITPELVDPSYLEVELNSTIYYNSTKTTRTQGEIILAATNAIKGYRDSVLNKFDGVLRFSKLSTQIDSVDQSIVSNITTFKLWCEITPRYSIDALYSLNLGNPIYYEKVSEESFKSTGFYIDTTDRIYYLDDDGVSSIRLFYYDPTTGEKIIENDSIGTVDYVNGIVKVYGLNINRLDEPNFYFIFKTQSYDVIPSRTQIVDIPNSRISVYAIEDKLSRGVTSNINNHTFTSSRS
jgi:hypothetical protein